MVRFKSKTKPKPRGWPSSLPLVSERRPGHTHKCPCEVVQSPELLHSRSVGQVAPKAATCSRKANPVPFCRAVGQHASTSVWEGWLGCSWFLQAIPLCLWKAEPAACRSALSCEWTRCTRGAMRLGPRRRSFISNSPWSFARPWQRVPPLRLASVCLERRRAWCGSVLRAAACEVFVVLQVGAN